jgi:hypothetical protein
VSRTDRKRGGLRLPRVSGGLGTPASSGASYGGAEASPSNRRGSGVDDDLREMFTGRRRGTESRGHEDDGL